MPELANDSKITVTSHEYLQGSVMMSFLFFRSSQDLIVYMDQQLIAVEILKEQHLQEVTFFLLFLVFHCNW